MPTARAANSWVQAVGPMLRGETIMDACWSASRRGPSRSTISMSWARWCHAVKSRSVTTSGRSMLGSRNGAMWSVKYRRDAKSGSPNSRWGEARRRGLVPAEAGNRICGGRTTWIVALMSSASTWFLSEFEHTQTSSTRESNSRSRCRRRLATVSRPASSESATRLSGRSSRCSDSRHEPSTMIRASGW